MRADDEITIQPIPIVEYTPEYLRWLEAQMSTGNMLVRIQQMTRAEFEAKYGVTPP